MIRDQNTVMSKPANCLIRNETYVPRWYIVRRRSKFLEFHGTCANCSINVPIVSSLLFPDDDVRTRTSIPALSIAFVSPFFHRTPLPLLSPVADGTGEHGVFKLSFEGEHEANASADRRRWCRFDFDERDTGHPVNGTACTISENVHRSLKIGMYKLAMGKRE